MSTDWEPSIKQRMFAAALGKMVAPMQSAEAISALIAMLPALKHLPDAMFERPGDLAADIALDMERMPTLSKLRKALDTWHDMHKPQLIFLPSGLEEAGLPSQERAMVATWVQHQSKGGLSRHDLTVRLSLIRRYAPQGYRWLIANNLQAAEIAVVQRWTYEAATDTEREATPRVVRDLSGQLRLQEPSDGTNRQPTSKAVSVA